MKLKYLVAKTYLLVSTCIILIPLTRSGAEEYESLKESSPFIPNGFKTKSSSSSNNQDKDAVYLFKSYIKIGGTLLFSIEDKANKKNFWIKEGEKGKPIEIESFDLKTKALTFVGDGKKVVAHIKEPDAPNGIVAKKKPTTRVTPTPTRTSVTKTVGNRPPVRRIIPRRTIKRVTPTKKP